MKTFKELHDMAVGYYDTADLGWQFYPAMDEKQKAWYYMLACKLERRAAQACEDLLSKAILFNSAAWIAIECEQYRRAAMLAYKCIGYFSNENDELIHECYSIIGRSVVKGNISHGEFKELMRWI
jgi:hypothetical protein